MAAPFHRRWPAVTALVVKDVKTFTRDPAQWAQALIFFGLLAIYIANLRNFQYPLDDPFYQNLICSLNLGATCLTLATMVSRFVFPMISLEGRRFWVLGLAPLERKRILWSKFYFSLVGSMLLTQPLVLLSNLILKTPFFLYRVQAVTATLICIGLTGLAVGMGAIFPSLRESSPLQDRLRLWRHADADSFDFRGGVDRRSRVGDRAPLFSTRARHGTGYGEHA